MQLVTKRLLLREFEGDDWLALTTFRADPLVARYADEDLSTPALAQAWICLLYTSRVSPYQPDSGLPSESIPARFGAAE